MMAEEESAARAAGMRDALNPPYYREGLRTRPLECIDVARLLPFGLGCAAKYIWRMGSKGPWREDLGKARWYLRDHARHRGGVCEMSAGTAALARLELADPGAAAEQPWPLRLAALKAVARGRCDLALDALERLGAWFAAREADNG